jgi:hypothetical protein
MQRVHTLMVETEPFLTALTFWRFGCQVLDVLLFAWLTLLPKLGPFPQMSHILDIFYCPPSLTEAFLYIRLIRYLQVKIIDAQHAQDAAGYGELR